MFNKKIDQSLWAILLADNENQQEIITFLKSIPQTLLMQIRTELSLSSQLNSDFSGTLLTERGLLFTYEIENENGDICLTIRQGLTAPEIKVPHISFSTELILKENPSLTLPIDDEYWLGTFTHEIDINSYHPLNTVQKKLDPVITFTQDVAQIDGYIKEQEVEYILIKKKNKSTVRKNLIFEKTESLPIDIVEIPESITMTDIENRFDSNPPTLKMTPSN